MRKRKSFIARIESGCYRVPKKLIDSDLLKAFGRTSKKKKIHWRGNER